MCWFKQEEWAQSAAEIEEGLSAGWLRPFVDKAYTLDQTDQAHRDIINSKGAKGKLVIHVEK